MGFEFDQQKSESNQVKHGINFLQAQALWDDPHLLETQLTPGDEPRAIVIGKIDETYWSAIVTYRQANTRIISVRRSRKEEIKRYESKSKRH